VSFFFNLDYQALERWAEQSREGSYN